jgi:hypothetical protein
MKARCDIIESGDKRLHRGEIKAKTVSDKMPEVTLSKIDAGRDDRLTEFCMTHPSEGILYGVACGSQLV